MNSVRWIFPVLTAAVAIFSIGLDVSGVSPSSMACAAGLCRFDQLYEGPLYSGVSAPELRPESAGLILLQDASNPSAWCTYAETLAAHGRDAEASAAFDRAIALGPHMPPVLMRAANFDFSRGRVDPALPLVRQILEQTPAFDQILFSYLTQLPQPARQLLGVAIPASPRAARAWLKWVAPQAPEEDLAAIWSWMRQNSVAGPSDAVGLVSTLCDRGLVPGAQRIWADWRGAAEPGYPDAEHLTNRNFEREPAGIPFDWSLPAARSGIAGVNIRRDQGLDVQFLGNANVDFSQIRQFTAVVPGRYRFSAVVEAKGLTSDQRPLFHVFDPVHPRNLDRETPQVAANIGRSEMTLDLDVPGATEILEVRIERRPGRGVDRNIKGTFHLYVVSLRPLGASSMSPGRLGMPAGSSASEPPTPSDSQRLARRLASSSAVR